MMRLLITALFLSHLFAAQAEAEMVGRVQQLGDGNFVFQPSDKTLPIQPLTGNSEALLRYEMLPQITVNTDTVTRVDETLKQNPGAAKLSSVSLFRQNEALFKGVQFDDLNTALKDLEVFADRTLTTGTMSSGLTTQDARSNWFKASALAARTSLDGLNSKQLNTEQTDRLLEIADLLAREIAELDPPDEPFADLDPIEKAFYAGAREYEPHIYRLIASNSQGAVGIKRLLSGGNEDLRCSGALIGPNLVLTARHCLYIKRDGVEERIKDSHLRVVHDFEERLAASDVKVTKVISEGDVSGEPGTRLDYALLEIESAPPRSVYFVDKESAASTPPRQICLSTQRVYRNEEVYVIGHPRRKMRKVADSGEVVFPWLVDKEIKGLLHRDVLKELHAAATARGADAAWIEELRQRWNASYVPQSGAASEDQFVHHSRQFGGVPTLGLKVNTFGGNSGGPVFSKQINQMVAIFRQGQRDNDIENVAGWERHEAALPVQLVIEDLNKKAPGWMETYGVCAWGKDDDFLEFWSDDSGLRSICEKICR